MDEILATCSVACDIQEVVHLCIHILLYCNAVSAYMHAHCVHAHCGGTAANLLTEWVLFELLSGVQSRPHCNSLKQNRCMG